MSIETNLASIAESLKIIAKVAQDMTGDKQPAPMPAPAPAPVLPAMPAPAPVPVPATPAPAPMPAFAMPPAPEAPAGPAAPFNDQKSLMAYVMDKYRKLGPIKGGLIQNVLSEIGLHNINDLQPQHYQVFYAKVEAIQ